MKAVRLICVALLLLATNICWIEAQTIRQKDKWGTMLFYVDETNTMHQKDKWGEKLFYYDGSVIRQKDKWGNALYYLDGNVLKIKDKWGCPLYYFEGIPEKWMIICIIG